MTYYFQIIIDTTCSMDIWIDRLKRQLYEFIQMCNLSNFKKINIISYSDYNNSVPVISSDWQDLDSDHIANFCKKLTLRLMSLYQICFDVPFPGNNIKSTII